jgi:putative ATPase
VFYFEPLSEDDVVGLLKRAIADKERGLGKYDIETEDKALKYLAAVCDGDARKALTALEVGILSQLHVKENKESAGKMPATRIKFDFQTAKDSIQGKTIDYDQTGDTHYDLASAFQKSMRGSDPDATVYWLARMIAGGEDVRFIARRIAVCAAEDVGNADPIATVLAASAFQISEFVGLPEAQLALAQAAIYVACAPKSNASSSAIGSAIGDVQNEKTVAVPKHLKDSHYAAAKKMGFGAEYKYPHSFEGGFVVQEYLPGGIKKKYYKPTERGYEKNIRGYLQKLEILIKDNKAKGIERPNGVG